MWSGGASWCAPAGNRPGQAAFRRTRTHHDDGTDGPRVSGLVSPPLPLGAGPLAAAPGRAALVAADPGGAIGDTDREDPIGISARSGTGRLARAARLPHGRVRAVHVPGDRGAA